MPEIRSEVAEALDPERFHLIVFATEQCNFRCTYCYEDFELGTVKGDVVEGLRRLISHKLGTVSQLQISWFGGEPLLARRQILDLSDHVYSNLKPDQLYSANMTTNAFLLTSSLFDKLVKRGVKTFQISLDGVEEVHNRSRVSRKGDGTFSDIWRNLLDIRDNSVSDATIILRLHYSMENWFLIEDLVKLVAENFASDPRFKVYFKSLERLGGSNDKAIKTVTESSKLRIAARLREALSSPEMEFRLNASKPYVCYASKANSLAVRADGSIAKCTVALSDPSNRIGKLRSDGTIAFDNDLLRPWLQGLTTGNANQLACPYGQMQSRVRQDKDRQEVSINI